MTPLNVCYTRVFGWRVWCDERRGEIPVLLGGTGLISCPHPSISGWHVFGWCWRRMEVGCGCQSIVCLHAFAPDTTRLVTWIAEFVDGWMNEWWTESFKDEKRDALKKSLWWIRLLWRKKPKLVVEGSVCWPPFWFPTPCKNLRHIKIGHTQ